MLVFKCSAARVNHTVISNYNEYYKFFSQKCHEKLIPFNEKILDNTDGRGVEFQVEKMQGFLYRLLIFATDCKKSTVNKQKCDKKGACVWRFFIMKRKILLVLSLTLVFLSSVFCLSACGKKDLSRSVKLMVDGEVYATVESNGKNKFVLPQSPEKEGYSFDGWYFDEGVWQKVFDEDSYSDKSFSSGASVYAKWNAVEYTVAFKANGTVVAQRTFTVEKLSVEEPVVPAKTGYNGKWENYTLGLSDITVNAVYSVITYNITYKNVGGIINNNPSSYTVEDLPFTFQDPEKNGYMFLGWYKNQDFSDNKIFGLPVDFAENVTLYAKWKPVEYGIYYDLCGGTNVSENPNSYTIESSDITLSSPVRSGYTFLGWYKTSDFTGDKVTVIKRGSSENISLFAQWQAIEYTATFKNGDEIVSTVKFTVENFVINEPYLPLRTGYTGRWEHYVLGASDITINAIYTPNEYTITYEDEFNAPNANKKTYTIESETITLVPLEKPGYEFLGWFNGSARIEKIERGSYGHRTLTARWQAAEYDVMYHLNGGTNAESNPEKYTIESADIELAAPRKDYYVFDGWYSDSAFSEKVEKISTGSYGNKEFYAKWKAVEYTASFQADGNIAGRVKFTVETVSITEPAVPEKAGYSGAWESYTLGTEDITINAVYTLITYKITYKNIDGTTNENPAEYNVEKLPLVLSATKLRGYMFVGWFEKEDLSGESVSEIASGRTGNLTFYAKWEVTEYSIEYELDGGTNNAQNPSAYTINSERIVLRAPEKDEFDFAGWYSDEAFTNRITEIAAGSVGNVKVYAKWVLPEPVYIITEDGEITGLTEHGKTLTVLNIPEKVNGITVTRIGEKAFTYCSNITSVTIPETVTSIGKMAFMRCTGLTSIVIPSRVTTVENYAFAECYGLKEVEIPSSIGEISYGMFVFCHNLAEVVIPEGITSIGKSAFQGCYKFTSIVIPSSVTLIDLNAFLDCYKLIEVINKSSLNIVKGGTDNGFVGYYALNVKKSGTSEIKNENGYLFYTYANLGIKYLLGYVGDADEIILPESYNGGDYEIYKYAFYGDTTLKRVVLGNGVKTINSYAFASCYELTEAVFSQKTETIGYYAFNGCTALKNVVIGDSVAYIRRNAFYNCGNLASVTIGSNVKTIESYAFGGDYHLVEVINKSSLNIEKGSTSNGYVAYYALQVKSTGNDGVVNKDGYLFYSCEDGVYLVGYEGNETDLILPDDFNGNQYSINYGAFTSLKNIRCVVISNGVIAIGDSAFSGCSNLLSVVIGENVASIGNTAFSGCEKLVEIINASALNIVKGSEDNGRVAYYALNVKNSGTSDITNKDGYLFLTCDGVNYLIAYVGTESNLILPENFNGQKYNIYKKALNSNSEISSVVISDGVVEIGEYAFSACEKLKSVTISSKVQAVKSYAFSYSGKELMVNIYYKGDFASWCDRNDAKNILAFENYHLYIDGKKIEGQLIIPETVTVIKPDAFYKCQDIIGLIINVNVTTIGNSAFRECRNLTTAIVGGSITTIDDYAFSYCSELIDITLGNKVESIGSMTFYECRKLKNVTIGIGLTKIEENGFRFCNGIQNVNYAGTAEQWRKITIGDSNQTLTSATFTYNVIVNY